MRAATLLLPARAQLGAQPLGERVARALARADALPAAGEGGQAQLARHFELVPRGWPVAALTRQGDAGDAADGTWLRADPAYVRPDINGVRLLAIGTRLQLGPEDVQALLPALQPVFGDAGLALDAPGPERWYLRLPPGSPLPAFAAPDEALGADLFDHLPEGPEGRRWRALLSEAQVVLHNHPWNARRVAAGQLPVNSLWFWGGGRLPDQVVSPHQRLQSDDPLLTAIGAAAGCAVAPLAAPFEAPLQGSTLYDLRTVPHQAWVQGDWLEPAVQALQLGDLDRLTLDFAQGRGLLLSPGQRWRVWRRPLRTLAP